MRAVLALPLLLAACDLPRDTEGTSERVAGDVVRIGFVEDGNSYNQDPAFLLAAVLRGRGRYEHAAAEPLLEKLERGELDLVVGLFAEDSPWSKRVHFSEHNFHGFRIATRLGEHRWAMTVDRAAKGAVR